VLKGEGGIVECSRRLIKGGVTRKKTGRSPSLWVRDSSGHNEGIFPLLFRMGGKGGGAHGGATNCSFLDSDLSV